MDVSLRYHCGDVARAISYLPPLSGGVLLKIRMMMAVDALQYFDRDPEISGRFPCVDTALHQPSRRGVFETIKDVVLADPGLLAHNAPTPLQGLDGLAVEVHDMSDAVGLVLTPPALHMGGKTLMKLRWRTLLIPPFSLLRSAPVKDAAIEINLPACRRW